MKFRIEHINVERKRAYIMARQLEAGEFRITEFSCLGGVLLKAQLNMPRALKPDGTPDLTIFCFYPQSRDLLSLLSVGDVVELVC